MGIASSLIVLILQRVTRSGRHVDVKCHQRCIQVIAALAVPFAFVAAILGLFAGSGPELCPHCEKISCIPFPWGCEESCWWDCSLVAADPRCSATASFVDDRSNGTVVVHCPVRDAIQNVTRHNLDVSRFDQHAVMKFCIDFC